MKEEKLKEIEYLPKEVWESALNALIAQISLFGWNKKELKLFIYRSLISEYHRGYNRCLKDFKIPNEFGEKSL